MGDKLSSESSLTTVTQMFRLENFVFGTCKVLYVDELIMMRLSIKENAVIILKVLYLKAVRKDRKRYYVLEDQIGSGQ